MCIRHRVDDVQDIEQLALVLMEALYLDVKDGVGVQRHSGLTGLSLIHIYVRLLEIWRNEEMAMANTEKK